ncbi:HIT domain-containing protein [Candidatus Pacearchaeota archaeon]|nr:HIT domain-containing protein [Candidatus Pacearchaeota archaeon]
MTLTKEQISELKKQLHSQISKMPENERKEAEAQIENLSDEAIESMLEQQKGSQKQIFREIISGNIPSKKVDENPSAIAVLEIKPISKGHTIIIPKEKMTNIDKIPTEIAILIDKVSKNIVEKLKAKNIKVAPELKFGEVIINLIPIYDKELSLESERSNPSEEELESLEKELKKEKKQEIKQEEPVKEKEPIKKFPKRIP